MSHPKGRRLDGDREAAATTDLQTMKDTDMPNTELLKATLDLIETFPERWDQQWWNADLSCGTAFCFGGWALALSDVPLRGDGGHVNWDDIPVDARELVEKRGVWHDNFGLGEPSIVDTGYAAAAVLGLAHAQGVELFASDNELADLRCIVAELCAEPEAAVAP